MVELYLAKVDVAGSNPVSRFEKGDSEYTLNRLLFTSEKAAACGGGMLIPRKPPSMVEIRRKSDKQ